MNHSIGLVLLAAGSSTRLGKSKQLLKLDGVPLLEHTIRIAQSAQLYNIVVVLGADASIHSAALQNIPRHHHNLILLENERWRTGMGNSIKMGLQHLIENTKSDAVLLMVCDQPFLTSMHIGKLISVKEETGKGIIASQYENTAGVPVIFSSKYFDSLLSIADNEGAKKIIQQHPNDIALVDFPEGKFDIDNEADIARFKAESGKSLE